MALILEDTYGNQYQASVATTQVSNYSADGMLTFKLIENEQTAYYINDVSKMWRVRNVKGNMDNQRYTVVIVNRTSPKDKQIVEVTAREEQFDYLANSRIYSNITGSRTPDVYFQSVFEDTPYQFTFLSPMPNAISWENAGDGDDRLSMFLKGLNRYGLEYRFDYDSGMFELADEIARRPAYQINKRINANNVHHEEDATQFFTYAEGYGNYDDGDSMQQAKLKKAYTSKLANIPGIGKRHAPALTDGRITSESTMIKKLTELVESSLKVSVTLDFVALPDDYPYARPEIGDIIPVIDKDIGYKQDLRINEMKIYRDAKHRVYKHDVTVGDRSRKSRYNVATRGAISTIQDITSGRYVFSTDVMPAAVKSATNKLLAANTELGFGEYGIRAIDKDNPNYVTLMNSAGLGVSTDGGQTFRSAITRGAINADLITAGSINANYIKTGVLNTQLVTIRGSATDSFIQMDNDEIISTGKFARTWANTSDVARLNLGIRQGRILVSNEDNGFNLYMTEKGLSTMMNAVSGDTAGTLEFHYQGYNESSRGVRLHSTYGAVALESDYSRIYTVANLTNNIESRQYGVYVRPFKDTRVGLNEFYFYVKEANSAGDTDGALLYGNLSDSSTHYGSGIRFSKSKSENTVYATNDNGDIGTGNFYANKLFGDWQSKSTNLYAMTAYDGALRITDKNGYNNGNPNYRDLQCKSIVADSIRTDGGNFYIGVSTDELRITNNLLYNGGNVGYKDIRLRDVNAMGSVYVPTGTVDAKYIKANGSSVSSSEKYKTNIMPWNYDATKALMGTKLYQYNYKNELSDGVDRVRHGVIVERETPEIFKDIFGDGVEHYEMISTLIKGFQEQQNQIENLKEKLEELQNG